MPAIHIIKNDPSLPQIRPVKPGSDVYTSGRWVLSEEKANALVGGNIYFRDAQLKPSFFGGLILSAEKIREGDAAGRFIFTFRSDPACKGITTPKEGWAQEMKLVF
jgi:hypothetical protein